MRFDMFVIFFQNYSFRTIWICSQKDNMTNKSSIDLVYSFSFKQTQTILWFQLSASQSRRHPGCSLAWLNCSVLRSAPAGPLALVPVNPAVHRSLLGNFQGTVEACQHPLLFQYTCIHTLFNSSAQNTRGLKKRVTWIFHRWWNGQNCRLCCGNGGIRNSFAIVEY